MRIWDCVFRNGQGLTKGPLLSLAVLMIAVAGCAPTSQPGPAGGVSVTSPPRAKTLTIPVLNVVSGFSPIGHGFSSPTGGHDGITEMHSHGLLTSPPKTRERIGLLAEKVPSLEDGSVVLPAEGGMRVVWSLRKDVTWHDGTPFTAQDLAFTVRLFKDEGIPRPAGTQIPSRITSVETPDAHTFVANFRNPYYGAISHSIDNFWPMPQHILGPVYETFLGSGNPEDVLTHRYWRDGYVHLGPFRITSFDPAGLMVFEKYAGYFRGVPKIDTVRVQIFLDESALFAALLAGTLDLYFESTIELEQSFLLGERWKETGEGVLYTAPSNVKILVPQHRPAYQEQPANLDPRIRIALSHALDREALSEALQAGRRELAAYGLLPASDPLHAAVRDTFRSHAYNPDRAKALLAEQGWTLGSDGRQRNPSGAIFRTSLIGTPGSEREVAAVSSYWRAIGLEVDEQQTPAALTSSPEARATYKGWELSTNNWTRAVGPPATAETRWVGGRSGYDSPVLNSLAERVQSTLSESEQLAAMREVNDFYQREAPLLPFMYNFHFIGVRKGVNVFHDDHEGGYPGTNFYGSHSRNAHLWDLE
jgi:peptide/nickel transport system substrate-binding protein